MSEPRVEEYTIGWICALQEEYEAACRMLDDEFDGPETGEINDNNTYVFGRVGGHNIVVACLPHGRYGTNSAASVAKDMIRSFPSLKFALMVGIEGGAPTRERDIRLGDVVVSVPQGQLGGVVQYDFGKRLSGGRFQQTGQLNSPPEVLLGALPEMQRRHNDPRKPDRIAEHIRLMDDMSDYRRPADDQLYRACYEHKGGESCADCEVDELEERAPRGTDREVIVHYGIIASANSVMKNAVERDQHSKDPSLNVLCFEMEAGGLMNNFPCLVIRGICDYSDSHKNDAWHKYAALAAAAYARELLHLVKPRKVAVLVPWTRVEGLLSDIKGGIESVIHHQHTLEEDMILKWLTPISYGAEQSDLLKRRQPGSGQWLLDTDHYQTWLKTSSKALFCPGIPGAGKTIITAVVVNELCTEFQCDPNVGIAYLYCNFRRWDGQKLEHLLASLLKQLIQERSSLPENVKGVYEQHSRKQTRPSLDEISKTLQTVASLYSGIFIIIDAVDECQNSENCRNKLLSEIFDLQAKSGANIFATSRFVPDIMTKFEDSMSIEIRANTDDVGRYLEDHMAQLPALEFATDNRQLQEEIKFGIIEAVDGMFLLAQLHLDSLAGKTSPKAIRTALKSLPTGSDAYDHAYKNTMERIKGQRQEWETLATQVISWITCSKRPLTTSEVQHALAVENGTTSLDQGNFTPIQLAVSVCAGLVATDEKSGSIRLVHYTAQEYFERTQKNCFPDAETNIAKACVTYLSFDIFGGGVCQTYFDFENRLKSNSLFDYAARNWGHHARMSSIEGGELILGFLRNENKVASSTQAMVASDLGEYNWKHSRASMTALHVTAYFGLHLSTAVLLNVKHSPSSKVIYSRTPLHYAVEKGYLEVVRLLLDKGSDPNIESRHDRWTPLHYAAANGHQHVVKLLLEKRANPHVQSRYGLTPLHYAAENGHQEVISILLRYHRDLNIQDSSDLRAAPLHYAAKNGHLEVVKLLLNANSNPHVDSRYGTPIHYAAEKGHHEVVKLLLENNVDPNGQDDSSYGLTPIHYAAKNGHVEVVHLLLENGTDPNLRTVRGLTALHYAAESGHRILIKFLLDRSADPNIRDHGERRSTPLHYATDNGHLEVVKLLLGKAANPNIKRGDDGGTPLHCAVKNGDMDLLNLLLERNVNTNARDDSKDGLMPLHYATKSGDLKVVKLLLENNASPEVKTRHDMTPLHYAAQNGHLEMVKVLLDKNASVCINWKDNSEHRLTPLHYATKSGDLKIVKLLLENNASPEVKTRHNMVPLHYAAQNGHLEILKLLLDSTVSTCISRQDTCGLTPLHYAIASQNLEVVELLLDNCAAPEIKELRSTILLDFAASNGTREILGLLLEMGFEWQILGGSAYGYAPIHYATMSRDLDLVKLLLANGANPNVKSRHGFTSLHLAAENGQLEVAKLLLDSGADPCDDRCLGGQEPVHFAAAKGHQEVVTLLLGYLLP